MKNSIIALLLLLSINSYSQIIFEKGYIINNLGEKKTCLIKNVDWKNNPTQIKYKLSETDDVKIVTITNLQEFGIDNVSKYIRFVVDIDRSSEIPAKIGEERKPIFLQETLLLKVLIEGDASLYMYKDKSLLRFFYSVNKQRVQQLVYKFYMTSHNRKGINEYFKQQILLSLKCKDISIKNIKYLNYKKHDLMKVFTVYNQCRNNGFKVFENKKNSFFNLYVRTGISNSSLTLKNSAYSSRDITFKNKLNYRIGVGTEFILPYNKDKWGLILEALYQSYQTEKTIDVDYIVGGKLITKVNYKSIEFPVGIRYYLFMDNSKLFISASYIFDYSFDSSIIHERINEEIINNLEIQSRNNFSIGIGYNYKRYSLELKIQKPRELLGNYTLWYSDYNTASIYLIYNIL